MNLYKRDTPFYSKWANHGVKVRGVIASVISHSPSVPFGACLSSSNTPLSANCHTSLLPDVGLQHCELMLLIYMVPYRSSNSFPSSECRCNSNKTQRRQSSLDLLVFFWILKDHNRDCACFNPFTTSHFTWNMFITCFVLFFLHWLNFIWSMKINFMIHKFV